MHKMQICKGKRELINAGLWSHSAGIIFHPILFFVNFVLKIFAYQKKSCNFAPLLTKSTSDKEVLERWQSGRLRRS